jgi:hypothetical protein
MPEWPLLNGYSVSEQNGVKTGEYTFICAHAQKPKLFGDFTYEDAFS